MRLEGILYRGNVVIGREMVGNSDTELGFHRRMTLCLIALCRALAIPLPLWLPKNTREIARFRQTLFFAEQFDEPVVFDRLQLRYLED